MCDRGTLCGECEQRGSIVECMRGGDRVALLLCVCVWGGCVTEGLYCGVCEVDL